MASWGKIQRRTAVGGVLAVASAVLIGMSASPALAASADNYAQWTIDGSTGAYTGTVQLAPGFPATTFTSDTLTPPTPPIGTGNTVWLPEGTPFGARFGSSQDLPYLNLRPAGNNVTSPSTTTYTFASPTPVGTWGITLGDIDAETLTVTALDAEGTALTAAQLGLQETFNYCDASPRSSSCSGQAAPYSIPTASTTATSVTVTNPLCPGTVDECDTQGAAAWFQPTVAVSQLTVSSRWEQGLPSYQTWFASETGGLTGVVDPACAPANGLSVQVLDPAGDTVASAPVEDSRYSFATLAARDYTVRINPILLPSLNSSEEQAAAVVGNQTTEVPLTVDSLVQIGGVIEGTGADTELDRSAITFILRDSTGVELGRTSPDDSGAYLFVAPANATYHVTATAPADIQVTPESLTFDVGCDRFNTLPFDATDTDVPEATLPPTTPATTPATDGSGTGTLAETGAESLLGWATAATLLAVLGALVLGTRRHRA